MWESCDSNAGQLTRPHRPSLKDQTPRGLASRSTQLSYFPIVLELNCLQGHISFGRLCTLFVEQYL